MISLAEYSTSTRRLLFLLVQVTFAIAAIQYPQLGEVRHHHNRGKDRVISSSTVSELSSIDATKGYQLPPPYGTVEYDSAITSSSWSRTKQYRTTSAEESTIYQTTGLTASAITYESSALGVTQSEAPIVTVITRPVTFTIVETIPIGNDQNQGLTSSTQSEPYATNFHHGTKPTSRASAFWGNMTSSSRTESILWPPQPFTTTVAGRMTVMTLKPATTFGSTPGFNWTQTILSTPTRQSPRPHRSSTRSQLSPSYSSKWWSPRPPFPTGNFSNPNGIINGSKPGWRPLPLSPGQVTINSSAWMPSNLRTYTLTPVTITSKNTSEEVWVTSLPPLTGTMEATPVPRPTSPCTTAYDQPPSWHRPTTTTTCSDSDGVVDGAIGNPSTSFSYSFTTVCESTTADGELWSRCTTLYVPRSTSSTSQSKTTPTQSPTKVSTKNHGFATIYTTITINEAAVESVLDQQEWWTKYHTKATRHPITMRI